METRQHFRQNKRSTAGTAAWQWITAV